MKNKLVKVFFSSMLIALSILSISACGKTNELKINEAKTLYYVGESVDLSAFKVDFIENGEITASDIEITEDMLSGFSTESVAYNKPVTVTYGGANAIFNITVIKNITSINISSYEPLVLVGQNIDLTKWKIKTVSSEAVQSDEITVTADMVTGFTTNEAGVKTVTVTYNGLTASVKVSVVEQFTSIEVSSYKQLYIVDEAVDYADWKIKTYAYDGAVSTEIAVTADMVTGFTTNEAGVKTVTVTYNGLTASVKVNVVEQYVGLFISKYKPVYIVGENINLNDWNIQTIDYLGVYSSDISVTIDMIVGFNSTRAGEISVDITYNGLTATVSLTIISDLEVAISLNKSLYFIGEDLDLTGAMLHLNNGVSIVDINITEEMVEGFNSDTVGIKMLTVEYENQLFYSSIYVIENDIIFEQTPQNPKMKLSIADSNITEANIKIFNHANQIEYDYTIDENLSNSIIDVDWGIYSRAVLAVKVGNKFFKNELNGFTVFADQYNIAVLNATFPVVLFTSTVVLDSDYPTFIGLERHTTIDWSKLPNNTYLIPGVTNLGTDSIAFWNNFLLSLDKGKELINRLREINDESIINLYLVDNTSVYLFNLLINNGVPEEYFTVTFLSDGGLTQDLFRTYFSGTNAKEVFDTMQEDISKQYNAAIEKKSYSLTSLPYYNSNYGIMSYNLALASIKSNIFYKVSSYDIEMMNSTIIKDEQFKQMFNSLVSKSDLRGVSVSDELSRLKDENKMLAFERMHKLTYGENDSGSIYNLLNSKDPSKKNIVVMGTRTGTEYAAGASIGFETYMNLIIDTFGDEYNIFYKGHPFTPTFPIDDSIVGSAEKVAYFEQNGVTDIVAAIPAEILMVLYSDSMVIGGYNSTLYLTAVDVVETLFLFGKPVLVSGSSSTFQLGGAGTIFNVEDFKNTYFIYPSSDSSIVMEQTLLNA